MKLAIVLSAGLLALVVVGFAPALHNGFIAFDDDVYITANPLLEDRPSLHTLHWAFTSFRASNWHPLTWLSHQADVALFGYDPRGHHLTSLAIHAANTLALFLLLLRWTAAPGRSACAAAVFAVHPLHVESVAWAAERKDVLSALFFLLTLAAYGRYASRPQARRYGVVLLCFTLGLLAKPTLVCLPPLLLLLDYWPLGRLRAGAARSLCGVPPLHAASLIVEKLPLLALAVCSGLMTIVAQSKGGALKTFEEYPLDVRMGNAVVSAACYLGKALLPNGLAFFYPHPGRSLSVAAVAAATLLLAAVTACAVLAARRRPYLLAGWGWYLVTLTPTLGFVQVGAQSMADRYTYIALTGLSLIAIWGLADLPVLWGRGARRATVAAAALTLLALTAATRIQVGVWHDSVRLFEHALAVTRNNFVAHDNLAGELARLGRTREGMRHALIALRIRPDREPSRYVRFGRALIGEGMNAEATEVLENAVRMNPTDPEAVRLLATARAGAGAR